MYSEIRSEPKKYATKAPITRNGPKGKGLPFFTLPVSIPATPTIVPTNVAIKKVRSTSFQPSTTPKTAKSFISPPPIPPRLTKIITRGTRVPMIRPAIGSHHGSVRMNILSIKNKTRKNKFTLSGIIIYFKSDTVTIMQSEISDHAIINSFDHPTKSGEIVKRIAVSSSIDGYSGEIDVLQFLHLPIWNKYDNIGISSLGDSFLSHTGQAELGYAMDFFSGTRSPTTLKKEPSVAPSMKM